MPSAEPGRLVLVDLAGSERAADRSAHTKDRMDEVGFKSLTRVLELNLDKGSLDQYFPDDIERLCPRACSSRGGALEKGRWQSWISAYTLQVSCYLLCSLLVPLKFA